MGKDYTETLEKRMGNVMVEKVFATDARIFFEAKMDTFPNCTERMPAFLEYEIKIQKRVGKDYTETIVKLKEKWCGGEILATDSRIFLKLRWMHSRIARKECQHSYLINVIRMCTSKKI